MPTVTLEDFCDTVGLPLAGNVVGSGGEFIKEIRLARQYPGLILKNMWFIAANGFVGKLQRGAPNLNFLDRLDDKYKLKLLDSMLGIRMTEVAPLTFARKVEPRALRQEFADYAKQQSLSYIAKVIEAGIEARLSPEPHPC